tara:strand:- start:41 stop:301 length:261 start_codon:yes stop_codon:yes gene_type:complete
MGLGSINISNSMGIGGSKYINNTASHTGNFTSIQFTEDSVISAYTGSIEDVANLISDGTVFGQGQVLYGPFSAVSLSSGAALLYKE